MGLVTILVMLAVFGPVLPLADPGRQDLRGRLAPPVWVGGSFAHPLGTDGLGHDVLARVVTGARVSLVVGLAATILAGLVGVSLGLAAGYAGGVVDRVVGWLSDVQMAIPFAIVAIAVTAATGSPSVRNVILVLAATGWVGYARIVRLQTQSLRAAPFVDAARAMGAGPIRIAGRHLLPNLGGPIAVIASQQIAAMILYEAALSYLGVGVPAATITWGGMLNDGRDSLLTAWWVSTVPGVAIGIAVLGFNLVGDWVAEGLSQ